MTTPKTSQAAPSIGRLRHGVFAVRPKIGQRTGFKFIGPVE
jgi:hypothetical protein